MTSQPSGPGEASEPVDPPQLAAPFAPAAAPTRQESTRTGDGMASQEPAVQEVPTDAAVAAYLLDHPSFFERHPNLVASLRIPHPTGPAISLVEHQVSILRGQLEDERRRLAHILSRARDYEGLSARLHTLTLSLIMAQDQRRVEEVLHDAMCRDLNAQCVALKLFELPPPGNPPEPSADPLLDAFHDFLDRRHCLCGALDAEKSRLLFGEFGASVQSAALIPIRAGDRSGVLAIGSSDATRFGPSMATDILDRMGEIVGHRLQSIHQGHG